MARAGASCESRWEGCFYIGLHRLAEGKRTEAKDWFTKSCETRVYAHDWLMRSRSFLAYIDDPAWLPWCVKEK